MKLTEERVERGIRSIDSIIVIALKWMKSNKTFMHKEFKEVFSEVSAELRSHYWDKWIESKKDFACFYLGADEMMKRKIFSYYEIPLEKDKYSSIDLNMAIIKGIPRIEVFPFESYIVSLFYLLAYNNSLSILGNALPQALERIRKKRVDLYGNGMNWSKAWQLLTLEEKVLFMEYIVDFK